MHALDDENNSNTLAWVTGNVGEKIRRRQDAQDNQGRGSICRVVLFPVLLDVNC